MRTELENLRAADPIAQQVITLGCKDVAISQADVLQDAFQPGYAFEIVGVEHFTDNIAATASYLVKIGTTNAISAATPTADTRGDATLVAGAVLGSATDVINLHATTDGSGTFTDLRVRVTIRPQGMRR